MKPKSKVRLDQWGRGYVFIKTKHGLPPMRWLTKVITSQFQSGLSVVEICQQLNCKWEVVEDCIRHELKIRG